MTKRLDNKKLLITLTILLIVVLVSQWVIRQREKTFNRALFATDTTQVTALLLYPSVDKHQALRFFKENDHWYVEKDSLVAEADQSRVKAMLNQLVNIEPKWLAAKTKNQWRPLEVNPAKATRIKVMYRDKKALDMMIGKTAQGRENLSLLERLSLEEKEDIKEEAIDYDLLIDKAGKERRKKINTTNSFIRLHGKDEVYAVEGYLQCYFNRSFNDWRNGSILKLKADKISKIAFDYPGKDAFVLIKHKGKWQIGGKTVDEEKMNSFLRNITNLSENRFDDQFLKKDATLLYQVTVSSEDNEPVVVKCYAGKEKDHYILHTSQNPTVYFSTKRWRVHKKLFVKRKDLFPKGY